MRKAPKRYSVTAKRTIVATVVKARETGSWKDALAAAQKVGYRGGQASLEEMFRQWRGGKAKAKPVRASKAKAAPAKIAYTAPALATAVMLDPVAAQYLTSAIDKAIGELQRLRKQYAR